jgi:hypothetical protein
MNQKVNPLKPFLPASPSRRIPNAAYSVGFPPTWSAEFLLQVLQCRKLANKKGPCFWHGPFGCWLPGQDSVTTVETFCFFLRNLPFGFLTQHIRGAFPPTWSAESSLRVLLSGKLANKKAHALGKGPLFAGSPGRTRTCNLVVSDDGRLFREEH